MIKLYRPREFKPWEGSFYVACSGGVDSMAVLHFFVKGGRKPHVMHIDHGTGNTAATDIVREYCAKHDLTLVIKGINPEKRMGDSQEEHWRNERLIHFNWPGVPPVITGHNLSDAMETWVFGSLNGQPKLIPYNTMNVYRPFLLNTKDELKEFAVQHGLEWYDDPSNDDVKYMRNRIRHNIIPEALQVNPGFGTMLKKRYISLIDREEVYESL
jgi:tRNA(Ile)-lysidine synthase